LPPSAAGSPRHIVGFLISATSVVAGFLAAATAAGGVAVVLSRNRQRP
jgi:hypothetical protein